MLLAELALIFVYVSVLLIKSCDMSAVSAAWRTRALDAAQGICTTYGFGENAEGEEHRSPQGSTHAHTRRRRRELDPLWYTGMFLFFLFFGLTMILLQLVIGVARLGIESFVPKILLVARAHALSPSSILCKVLTRRHAEAPRTPPSLMSPC